MNKKEKATLKNVHEHVDLFAKEKSFDLKDMKALRDMQYLSYFFSVLRWNDIV